MNTSHLSNPAEFVAETPGQEREKCLVEAVVAIMPEPPRTCGRQVGMQAPLQPSPTDAGRLKAPRLQAENAHNKGDNPTNLEEKILNPPRTKRISLRALTSFLVDYRHQFQPSLPLEWPMTVKSLACVPLLLMALAPTLTSQLEAQTLLNAELTGTQNRLATGAELTVQSGATLTASAGSIVDLFHATVAFPESLTLKNVNIQGTANELNNGSTITLSSGSTFTASSGSTLDLGAASITFPDTVVLTTGNQILSGKTFTSPTLNGIVTLANGASVDLGTGAMIDPIADTIQPLKWGSGGRYMLNAGYTWFKSPAYPSGVIDHLGGLGYNLGTPPVSGDVQFGTIFESRFQNDPKGVDTEYYFTWNGPVGVPVESGGRNGRRIFQSNVSWGISNYSSDRLMGSANWNFDLNSYTLRNGADADHTLDIELGANDSPRSTHTWRWYGGAAQFDGAFSIGGDITQLNVSTNSFNGPTTFNNANLTLNNATNPLITVTQTSSGDTGIHLNRNPSGLEYIQIGAADGGMISGGLSNSYFYDIVGSTVGTVRPLHFRFSSDSGGNFSNLVRFDPLGSNGVAIRSFSTTEASDATTASVVLDGGLSVAKSVRIASPSSSTSTTTGALVVAGGVGISGSLYSADYATSGTISTKGSGNSSISMDSANNSATLNLISNSIGNFRKVNFGYGSSPEINWILGYNGYFPSTWIGIYNNVSGGAMMLDANNNLYIGNKNTAISGSYNLALEGGVIDTRTTAPIVLRQNGATALTIANSTLSATFASTAQSTSTTNGALVIAGGVGIAGNQFLGGSLNLPGGGSIAGSAGALTFTSGGTSQNITLTPSGTGVVTTPGAFRAGGDLSTSATTASASPTTGALTVAGGFGLGGDLFVGGSINFSGAGLIASGGSLSFTAGGSNQNITLTPSGTGILSTAGPFSAAGAITTTATTTSTSTSTGALVVAGGFGLGGDQYLGGSLNFSGAGVLTSGGSLTISAGGTNQNITLTPSGTGSIVMTGPVTFSGNQTFAGALTLSGGGSLAGAAGSVDVTAGGTNKNITLTPSGTGSVAVTGPLSVTGNQTLAGSLALSGGGTLGGSSGSLTLAAAGTNQNVTLAPSGNGTVTLTGPVTTTGALSVSATAPSTSTSTGALVVAGGFGLAGNQFLGGSLNLPGGGSLTGATGSLTLTAGGTNQNISLTPSGSGVVVLAGPVSGSGKVNLDSATDSTSTSTGALVVSGGAAIQKKTFLGDDLVLVPTTSTAATVRLSGTTLTDIPGLWFRDGGKPTSTNVTLSSSAFTTILNGPSSGSLSLRVGNTNYLTLNATSATLQTIPLRVISASASTSTTTGSATFAGGIGVSGRTSTGSLNVGSGTSVLAIYSVTTSLDFPLIAADGGVQDLSFSVTGATVGNDVNIVEAGGAFTDAGIIVRGIVSSSGTVTVRATNTTAAAINPAATLYRLTVTKF